MTIQRPIAMRDAFLKRIHQEMYQDENIFFVSADFGSPVLDSIRADFSNRFVNVGIAEQNLINVSAGLGLEGYKVFAYAIAPFITMRCYEQIRVNLALLSTVRKMNVNLIGVGAGYSYVVSGPTHQCYEDISIMRALPTFEVLSPCDSISAANLFERCHLLDGPKYIRLDAQILPPVYEHHEWSLPAGFNHLKKGKDICIIATGYMVHTALQLAQQLQKNDIEIGVIDLFNVTHFSDEAFKYELQSYKHIISLEEGFVGKGGMDMMILNWLNKNHLSKNLHNFGVKGSYQFELGNRLELHQKIGLGFDEIYQSILRIKQACFVE